MAKVLSFTVGLIVVMGLFVGCFKSVTQPDGTTTKVLDVAKTQPIVNLRLKAGAITLCRYEVPKTEASVATLKLAYATAQKNPQGAYEQLALLKADPAIAALYSVFTDVLGLVEGAAPSDWMTLANGGTESVLQGCASGLGVILA